MRRAGVACDARDDSEGGSHGDGDGRDHALSPTIVHGFQKGVHLAIKARTFGITTGHDKTRDLLFEAIGIYTMLTMYVRRKVAINTHGSFMVQWYPDPPPQQQRSTRQHRR